MRIIPETPAAAATPPRAPSPRARRRRRWAWIIALVLAPILAPLLSLPFAQARILAALRAGLGRGVSADAAHLELFPWPGVELDGVRVAEDPAFGREDMVIADDARASLRLRSLFAGHLVFSSIRLDRPSINLVRNDAGQWNIAGLLRHSPAAAAGAAPGSMPGPAPGPSLDARFPYIEWSEARVNFKLHQAKTRFYLDQVTGSLARESTGWRLQARFQPQRSDLNLSDTGDISLDGRWFTAAAAPLGAPRPGLGIPFDLVARVENSYLAGSSALFAGHDAGVHGILGAQIHVQGTARRFRIVGAARIQALRRWDLLPPAASVSGEFAAVYTPAADQLDIEGIGDPGWRHLRVQGVVRDLFAQSAGALSLDLRDLAASDLLPLAQALKARLPAQLQADGAADGQAEMQWAPGRFSGLGRFELTAARWRAGAGEKEELRIPAARLLWDGHRLSLPPTPVTLASQSETVPLRVGAEVRRDGFSLRLSSPAFTRQGARTLADLAGLRPIWPAPIAGLAQLKLALDSSWADYRRAGWRGQLLLPAAAFQPPGDPPVALANLSVTFADPLPPSLRFTARLGPGADPAPGLVSVTLPLPAPGAPATGFALHAHQLEDGAVWSFLHPAPADLVARMFGGAPPAWVRQLRARGAVSVDDLLWRGFHAGLRMDLDADPRQWNAAHLDLSLAGGAFAGSARLRDGQYLVAGDAAGIGLAALLASTPYQGRLSGTLAGALQLTRGAGDAGWDQMQASGNFVILHGTLLLGDSPRPAPFDRFSATFALRQGVLQLTQVVWEAHGRRLEGTGSARLGRDFDLQLHGPAGKLDLAGDLRAPQP